MDAAAQTLPDYMRVKEFIGVTRCVGKSCIEADAKLTPLPNGWPANGAISMKDVYFDYQTGAPCALNGVTVDIKSGEKIGVCGRTGEPAELCIVPTVIACLCLPVSCCRAFSYRQICLALRF